MKHIVRQRIKEGEIRLSKYGIVVVSFVLFLCFCGCGVERTDKEKVKDCEFTVLEKSEIPKELGVLIEERKKKSFKLSYAEDGYLYIIQGYGKQIGGGYSISVQDLYETKGEICIKTNLRGPKEKTDGEGESYPYVVIKMEYMEKEVSFLD